MQKYLTIHGHFYQPPRENPWLGVIERQESASPFQNWNERITAECYKANTLSRTLDPKGKILEIVNNFKYLSFNVGPTLLDWLQEHHIATYEAIIAADHESRKLNGGHGNAIAQVYNHIIMPLATREEQQIQIGLGKKQFQKHFGREPEAMWLAETAINDETLGLLIEQGIRFLILSPDQALRTKKITDDHWKDVSHGNIDTTMPCRVFSNNGHLDIFFYNKPVSSAVAFEHLLKDAHKLAKKLASIPVAKNGAKLVNISTDGESYGHHEPFGDMCLAAFFSGIIKNFGFQVINYGYFLEKFPPVMEVQLKPGEDGKGTAWSCSHGVGRWQRDCGCSTGGKTNWNQKWREPFRTGLRKLKESLDKIYEENLSQHVTDQQALLWDFIEIRRSRLKQDIDAFFAKHFQSSLENGEREGILRLLESQLNSHFMFTSCAWFFDDISGIEPMQNLKFAARAIEMAGRPEMVEILLNELEKARSNIDHKTGKSLYLKEVAPLGKTYDLVANQAIMELALLDKKRGKYYFYEVEAEARAQFDHLAVTSGTIRLKDSFLGIQKNYFFFCFRSNRNYLETWLGENLHEGTQSAILEKLAYLDKELSASNASQIGKEYGLLPYDLSDLIETNREQILAKAMEQDFADLKKSALALFDKNKDLMAHMVRFGLDLPPEMRFAVSYTVHHKVKIGMENLKGETEPEKFIDLIELVRFAKSLQIPLKMEFEQCVISETLLQKLRLLIKSRDLKTFVEIQNLMEIAVAFDLKIDLAPAQNILFGYLKGPFLELAHGLQETDQGVSSHQFADKLLEISEKNFMINVDRFRSELGT